MAVAVEAGGSSLAISRDCGESRMEHSCGDLFVAFSCATVDNPCTVSLSTRKGQDYRAGEEESREFSIVMMAFQSIDLSLFFFRDRSYHC
jgi:hypothetical protein